MDDEELQSLVPSSSPVRRPQTHSLQASQAARVLLHQPSLDSGKRQDSRDSNAAVSSWDAHALPSPVRF